MRLKATSPPQSPIGDSSPHEWGSHKNLTTMRGIYMENKFKRVEGGVTYPQGFKAAGIHCGLRKNKTKKDLALIVSDVECSAAAIYTTNKVYGAPITVTREHLKDGKIALTDQVIGSR